MTTDTGTATQILDVAQQLIQARGYNGFSYADIAAAVGIKKASIHYYFPSKSDLCRTVIRRHRLTFAAQLAQIDGHSSDAAQKLKAYLQLYADIQHVPELVCVCGMLAADVQSLPSTVHLEVQGFFTDNEAWLTNVIAQGVQVGVLHIAGSVAGSESAQQEAQLLVAGVQGALLVARSFNESSRFQQIAQRLLERLLVG